MPRKKQTKSGDTIIKVNNPREGDVIIPIVGVTGVGKSTFINTAAGAKYAATSVGHDLASCTKKIQPVIIPHPRNKNRRVIFVDTPGFNDTWLDDVEILRRITAWLEYSCEAGMKFAGIIYLHEISQTRGDVTGKDAVFDTLCRRSTIKNIIHATTKWRKPTGEEQRRREQQLSKQSWAGPHIPRFVGTQESVWAIVDLILQKDPLDTPQFREALLNLKRHLPTPKKRSNGGILAAIFGKIFA